MFITNSCALFHLWWKDNLVKHQKASKCYENDCRSDEAYLERTSASFQNFAFWSNNFKWGKTLTIHFLKKLFNWFNKACIIDAIWCYLFYNLLGKWKLASKAVVITDNGSVGGGCYFLTKRFRRKLDIGTFTSGILAGLLSVTAICAICQPWEVLFIGWTGTMISSYGRYQEPI